MAEEVSFLDAATKRGVVNIAQQSASSLGTLANAVAKQKFKEDKAAKEQLNQIAKMVTPPGKLHKLVKEPAAQNYVAAIKNVYSAYNSGDPNWQTKAMEQFGNYTTDLAAKKALSDNLDAFDKARRNKEIYVPKNLRKLGEQIDSSNNAEQFIEKYTKDPVPGIDLENLNVENIPTKKKIPIQSYSNSVFDKIEPVQLGVGKETVVVSNEKEADDYQKKTGVRPNSIEKVVDNRFLDDFEFLEQYIDYKNLDIDYTNIGPEERETLRKELIKDGQQFVMKKFPPEKTNIKVVVNTGAETKETLYGFNKGVSLAPYKKVVSGVTKDNFTPLFGNLKPTEQKTFTITAYKGTLDRRGDPVSNVVNKAAELSAVTIIPYKIDKGVEKGVFDPLRVKEATGFKIYYQFGGGDYYIPADQLPNLNFNVGGKDPVATLQYSLDQMKQYKKELNEYHRKVKQGQIKNPLLYKKLEEMSKNLITTDEFTNFVNTFKYDK